ncbi:DNA polymerase-1 [Streptosporangium canum]|uniref:DNA polymerase I n=1 Tax=Streptosporangium canum TaxID=324952 RepID=A0A1I3L5E7_9ACTN|nr:DNA polymerase [Streptosporangium canum]SFI79930.1 DNA polymerase-1 [Streptosporangium canum]
MRTHEMRLAGRTVTGHVVETQEDLPAFADWAGRHTEFGYDTETTSLEVYKPGFRVRAAQFSAGDQTWFLPVERHPRFAWYTTTTLRHAKQLYIHNAAFDLQVADRHLGVPLAELFPKTIDTGIISRLVDSRARKEGGPGHKLEELTEVFIDPVAAKQIKGSVGQQCKELGLKKADYFEQVSLDDEIFQMYALMDPVLAWVLAKTLLPKVPDSARHLIGYEHEIARICSDISKQGFLLDQPYTNELATRLRQEETWWQMEIEREVEKLGFIDVDEFNPNSTDNVFEALVYMGHLEFKQTPTGKPQVDDDLLEHLAEGGMYFARCIKEMRKAGKWAGTWPESFLANADEHGRCHANINTLQARTGRMSITGIPAQTLPSGDWIVRRCFLADEGHVMASIDYAAQELRMAAVLSGDERMYRAFELGEDLHQITADAAGVTRKIGKMANFLVCYGGGWKALVEQAKIPEAMARKTIAGFNKAYPGVSKLAKEMTATAGKQGYIETITGRRLYVDSARAYSAINYAIQSASRDVTARGLIKADRAGLTSFLRLPVHDEVVASLPKNQANDLAKEIGECLRTQIKGVDFVTEPEVAARSWGSLYGADH